jgi:hypothetical protein
LFNQKHSKKAPSFDLLRRIFGKEKGVFIYFGRTSTYGLAEWEQTQEAIKGGTIRSIIEGYLESFEEPKHISELAEYVSQYRPKSSFHSIHTNLQFDKSNRFKEFKGGFWGLTSKNYDNQVLKQHPRFFFKQVEKMILTLPEADYETIVLALSDRFQLKKVQVQYLIERNITLGRFRHENNLLKINPNYSCTNNVLGHGKKTIQLA